MASVIVFEDCESLGDCNRAFLQWAADNPKGFYLNRRARRSALLHAVGCKHVFLPEDGSNTTFAKVCAMSIELLIEWARENDVDDDECKDCFPVDT